MAGEHKYNKTSDAMKKNRAREGVERANLDTASYCPRKRQRGALIFSKGSTLSTQHMRVGPGTEINSSESTNLPPSMVSLPRTWSVTSLLRSVIYRPAWGPSPFVGQELPMLPILIPASQLSGQEAGTFHLPKARQPFVKPCPGMS